MKFISFIINTNFFLATTAVLLTIQTQVQLNSNIMFEAYLFLIFFATLFEYNLHRISIIIFNKKALNIPKNEWIRNNTHLVFSIFSIASGGLIVSAFFCDLKTLLLFLPIAVLTLLYSLPLIKFKGKLRRLESFPIIKTFLIAFVWSFATVYIVDMTYSFPFANPETNRIFFERFFFILAIALPFDIRDINVDQHKGMLTLPILLGEKPTKILAVLYLLIFIAFAFYHFTYYQNLYIVIAQILSAVISIIVILSNRIKKLPNYYNGILDGMLFLQSLLIIAAHLICK